MNLSQITKALQGTKNGRWVNISGPGHRSDDRSLGIRFDNNAPDGFWLHSLAADDPSLCRAYVIQLLSAAHTATADPSDDLRTNQCRKRRIKAAIRNWDDSVPPRGTPVLSYLAARQCTPRASIIDGSSLRFHSNCPFASYRVPAMVALMRNVVSGEAVGVHLTALNDAGNGKRVFPDGVGPKRAKGAAKGAAAMLMPPGPHLGIAEGIETALAAQEIFNIPVWAALSAPGIAAFPLLRGLKRLTIFADHDSVGVDAARQCAGRYSRAGIDAQVTFPFESGTDYADLIKKWGQPK